MQNPGPPLELISGLIPYMSELLRHPHKAVRVDTAWAISYVTDGPDEQVRGDEVEKEGLQTKKK